MARSNGLTAVYYELPPDAKQLQDLIAYRDMNAQMGEIFRASYRYGQVDHSDKLRDINKILFYAQAEKERLIKYGLQGQDENVTPSHRTEEFLADLARENIMADRKRLLAKAYDRQISDPPGPPPRNAPQDEMSEQEKLNSEPSPPASTGRKAQEKPKCSVCKTTIVGAPFYTGLGKEPRCYKHIGGY